MKKFSFDLEFLQRKDKDLTILSSSDGKSQLLFSAKYQGKVFTTTTDGLNGNSIGFINYDAFDCDENDHINVFGGENRFWLGPEGGKFSVFFCKNAEQSVENWFTPKAIDTEEWKLIASDKTKVTVEKETVLVNTLETTLKMKLQRSVTLLSVADIENLLSIQLPDNVRHSAYETVNAVTNLNDFEWNEKTGTVCIWMLDMFPPSGKALTIIPYNERLEKNPKTVVKTNYFGEIPDDRIQFRNGNVYLKTDGQYRCKIGIKNLYTGSIAGNYDSENNLFTVILFDKKSDEPYLNQQWGAGEPVFGGDMVNAYNDGPMDDGSILGPFYELESSSPAAFLKPDNVLTHKHTVFHFSGEPENLNDIIQKLFGVGIHQLTTIF